MRVLTDKNGKPLLDANGNILLAPSNEKLIFTGGEEKTYDGSEEVEIHLSGVKSISAGGVALATDENGNVDVPMAQNGISGLVKINEARGIRINNGDIAIFPAIESIISSDRSQATGNALYRPITPFYLDYAVKAAMCDGKGAAWTEAEQKAACTRSGAVYDGQFELIEEITLTEDVASIERSAEPNGTTYNFRDIFIQIDTPMGDYGYTGTYINISFTTANNKIMTCYSSFKPTASYNSRYHAFCYIRNGSIFAESSDTTAIYGTFPNGSSDPIPLKKKSYLLLDDSYLANIRIYTRDEQKPIPSGTIIRIYGVRA